MKNDRRSFLRTLGTVTAGMLVAKADALETTQSSRDRLGELLPLRRLGSTGQEVTMLGVGGAHVGKSDEKTAQSILEAALEGGVRFFDNAESYNAGGSEEKYGKYLVPKYRDVAFIMTKSTAKTGELAQQHFEDSLRRMKTDYVDLWQIHAVTSPDDVDARIENGVLEVARKAKESGKHDLLGSPDILISMLINACWNVPIFSRLVRCRSTVLIPTTRVLSIMSCRSWWIGKWVFWR